MHRHVRPHRLALGLVVALAACSTTPPDPAADAAAEPGSAEAAVLAAAEAADAAATSQDARSTPSPIAQVQRENVRTEARARRAQPRGDAPAAKQREVGIVSHTSPIAPPAPPLAMSAPAESTELDKVVVTGSRMAGGDGYRYAQPAMAIAPQQPANTEKYAHRTDNPVQRASEQPISTFSIDVDTGSYSNVRRMLTQGVRPPADAVRAEEFINYFDYGHPGPASRETPFRVTTELSTAPWNQERQLLMVGIKGFDVPKAHLPPANLVFLIDTSGSMHSADKLPLVKASLRALVTQLRPQDRVSMVVYAGSAGLVLPPTSGENKDEILGALDRLEAGGSTNGGDGIRLAYAMAQQAFVEGGVNRVILATDGDFNVGTVDQNALETMVADQRKTGIALTTLGFGQGNYNDQLAERLADVGDGNHAYIDTEREARKVLVQEMGATLMTIARDVKIQIEFNPAVVAEYRLIGYENRLLNREDFANDKVDAGDIGAGHQVTALYEITPVASDAKRLPELRYGATAVTPARGKAQAELAHLRLRYKRPGEDRSRLIEKPVLRSQWTATPSETMRFAGAVAAFADALRGGKNVGEWNWAQIRGAAAQALGEDRWGQRAELLALIDHADRLIGTPAPTTAQVSE